MKKYLFLAVTAIVALASCSDNSLVGEGVVVPVENELTPITFSSSSAATTRGDYTGEAAANKLNKKFIVGGFKGTTSPATTSVYDNYQVQWTDNTAYTSTSNTSGWEYVGLDFLAPSSLVNTAGVKQSIKYWDYSTSQYDFIAYSTNNADVTATGTDQQAVTGEKVLVTAITPATATTNAYQLTGKADELAKCYIADMKTIYRDKDAANDVKGDYNKEVELKFRSLNSKVRIGLYETVPGYSVKDVVFYSDATTAATDGKAHLFTTGDDVFNVNGTYTVYFPTIGSANKNAADYNKAHLSFSPVFSTGTSKDKLFGALTGSLSVENFAEKEGQEAEGNYYLGRTSTSAIYAGAKNDNYYTVVMPNEAGAALNLKVNYTLLATDGSGEVINVTGAYAKVPAQYAQWKSGYAYTYLFKVSENTPGKTNPNLGPAGLYPITFDAVVTETEDGIQETITTVAEPSITTFGVKSGKFTTGTDEYKSGTTIYVTCLNADGSVFDPTLGGNTHIYRVESADETNFPITEASVAESQQHPAGNKITVTHECCGYNSAAKVTSVPAEDGTTKTINAIMFTPVTTANKVFAVRYTTNTPVPATYTSSVLPEGTSLEGYYYIPYVACTGGKGDGTTVYYKQTTIYHSLGVLAENTPVDGYYTYDGTSVYTVCAANTKADGSTTYYVAIPGYIEEVPNSETDLKDTYYTIGTGEHQACDVNGLADGVTTYYLPATYSTAPVYAYKIIRIKH